MFQISVTSPASSSVYISPIPHSAAGMHLFANSSPLAYPPFCWSSMSQASFQLLGDLPASPVSSDVHHTTSLQETQFLLAAINQAREQESFLEKKVTELQDELHTYLGALSHRSKFIARRHNLLSPINRLPLELLAEVFRLHSHCWDSGVDNERSEGWLGPDHLIQVCRLWRSISLAQADLWTSIVFDISHPFLKSPVRLDRRIQRSGDQHLDVYLYLESFDMIETPQAAIEYSFRLLLKSASRWRRLEVYNFGVVPDFLQCVYKLPTLPLLRASTIDASESENPEADIAPWLALVNSSTLHKLHIMGGWMDYEPGLRQFINKHSLIEIRLDEPYIPWGEVLEMISSQPSLEIFECSSGFDLELPLPSINIFHRNLRKLVVYHCHREPTDTLLDHLILPNLITFGLPGIIPKVTPALERFFSRSPKLQDIFFLQRLAFYPQPTVSLFDVKLILPSNLMTFGLWLHLVSAQHPETQWVSLLEDVDKWVQSLPRFFAQDSLARSPPSCHIYLKVHSLPNIAALQNLVFNSPCRY
ncbi:hypothetical protein DL96DRAFT_1586139 [Flagelloscypha sp. PMI_526]|nr:hypothetical protein DL96DRAFT_1586139 [Flagelloscypha sp. PMI_526]